MSRTTKSFGQGLAIVAVTVTLTLPGPARAQDLKGTVPSAAAARAAVLEFSAEKMLGHQNQWVAAGRLLEQAAAPRQPGDPMALKDLTLAGSAYYWSGKRTHGREVYVQAAERALADGDVETAARSFLTAAVIANQQHDASTVELKERAERLANSPLLNETQKRVILGQFGALPVRVVVK